MSYCPFHSIRFYTQVHYYLLAPRQHQIIPIIIFILTRDSSSSISLLFISVTIITTDTAFLDLKVVYIHFVQFGFQSNPSQLLKYILWYSIHDNDEYWLYCPPTGFDGSSGGCDGEESTVVSISHLPCWYRCWWCCHGSRAVVAIIFHSDIAADGGIVVVVVRSFVNGYGSLIAIDIPSELKSESVLIPNSQ